MSFSSDVLLSMALHTTRVQHFVWMRIMLRELGELPLPADKIAFLLAPFVGKQL